MINFTLILFLIVSVLGWLVFGMLALKESKGITVLNIIGALITVIVITLICLPLNSAWVLILIAVMWLTAIILNIGIGSGPVFNNNLENKATGLAIVLFVFVIVMACINVGSITFCSDSLHDIPNVDIIDNLSNDTNIISSEHIRKVSIDSSVWKADKIVGSYGYKSNIGDPDIQVINNNLYWVLPLEYRDIIKSIVNSNEGTGGFVMVNAEEQYSDPVFVEYDIKYAPSAFLFENIGLYTYLNYPQYTHTEFVFMVNENASEALYVTQLTTPHTITGYGYDIEKIITINPTNGEIKEYNIGEAPDWIDRTMSEQVVESYYNDWGAYPHGWLNSWLDEKDVIKLTGEPKMETSDSGEVYVSSGSKDVYYTIDKTGKTVWYSCFTTKGKDSSMVGYAVCDANTNSIKYYTANGLFNDIGAVSNIQSDPEVSKSVGMYVTPAIMYNIDNTNMWISPIVSLNGETKLYGICLANGGDTFIGSTIEECLKEYNSKYNSNPVISEEGSSIEETINNIKITIANLTDQVEQLENLI